MEAIYSVPRGPQPINYYRSTVNVGQKFRVGPHKKEAISMARVRYHFSGRLRMHVYDGPTEKDKKLATIETLAPPKQSLIKRLFTVSGTRGGVPDDIDIILFPDQAGCEIHPNKTQGPGERIQIRGRQFNFTVPVGNSSTNNNRRVEEFEWRWSDGSEVGHYTSRIPETSGRGWKLLRLDTEGQDGSMDGKECVAAFARANKTAGTKTHRYQLFNSGASGRLGGRFELYAYLTFLTVLDHEAREALVQAQADAAAANAWMTSRNNRRHHSM
ncbi:hypothetical protein VMCG_03744 [Cytospora schulzeri]|uniref:Uncharacterized protein n=1 Tax=Cytospora schulzeri TaxID=448051 RepID=A0A423WVC9_9PEZI|nr:hypothetical protein VMCG_03744 [Valsa malicola]